MSERLERRYRRLLALFPAAHRREYADEMLGVLMAGAEPGQRFPSLRESANLVGCAVWMRLAGRWAGSGARFWGSAAAAFGLLAAMVLAAQTLGAVAEAGLWTWRLNGRLPVPPASVWLPAVCWVVAVAAAFTRFRLVAAAAAWAATVHQAVSLFAAYPSWPDGLVQAWPMLVLAVSAALALTAGRPGRGHAVLGRLRTLLMALAVTVFAALPAVELALATVRRYGDGGGSVSAWGGLNTSGWSGGFGVAGWITLVAQPICALVLLACLLSTAAPVRRRLLAMAAPALLMFVVVPPAFSGFLGSSGRFDPPVLLVPAQWAFLVAAPVLTVIAGALLVARAERHAYLIGLGRAAERRALEDPTPS